MWQHIYLYLYVQFEASKYRYFRVSISDFLLHTPFKIIEYAELEGAHKDHRAQLPAPHRSIQKFRPCDLSAQSKSFLNSDRLGDGFFEL